MGKQVEGKEGLKLLIEKVKKHPTALWQGAVGAMTATWVGHYPWFYTNNQLNETLPKFDFLYGKYVRNAVIGFASAAVSDTCSNSLRVLKTTRQTALPDFSGVAWAHASSLMASREPSSPLAGRQSL